VAYWGTKAAISLERVKIEEMLLWTAHRKSPTLFQMVPFPTPYSPPLPRNWRFATELPLLSQDQVKLRTSNFVGTFKGSIGTKAHI